MVWLEKRRDGWRTATKIIHDYQLLALERMNEAQKHSPLDPQFESVEPIKVSFYIEDFDYDGKPELIVRHKPGPHIDEEGSGSDTFTRMDVFNPGQTLTRSVSMELRLGIGAGHHGEQWQTQINRFELNGDGYPDLLVSSRFSEFYCNLYTYNNEWKTSVYHWNSQTDQFDLIEVDEGEVEDSKGWW